MKILRNKTAWVAASLVLLMALTRYNHFGSAVTLPDASYAVFFLGGLFLGRVRHAWALLLALLAEAALVDYYATHVAGVSDWCVTPAYGFLAVAYGAIWEVGRWYAPHHRIGVRRLPALASAAVVAVLLGFVIANVSFYLFSGYYESMAAGEYARRVAPYAVSYVSVAMTYIGLAALVEMLFAGRIQPDTHVA